MSVELTQKNFKSEVLEEKHVKTVIIKCFHDKCAPCKQIEPILQELEKTVKSVKFVTVDTMKEMMLAASLDVRAVPSLIKYENGHEVNRLVGFVTAEKIREFVKK